MAAERRALDAGVLNAKGSLMITLTTPKAINNVLGSNATVAYNKLVIGPFTFDPVTKNIQAALSLTVSADPDSQPISGRLTITPATSTLEFRMDQIDLLRRVKLTGPQNAAAMAVVTNAQDALESGIVSLGVVAGVQTSGV